MVPGLKTTKLLFLPLFLLWFCQNVNTQEIVGEGRGDLRIMFYNVENLFDTVDDTLCQDEEFLPYGEKHWTPKRYMNKLNNLYKVVVALGEWRPPEIIGLCEVENRKVLEDLIHKTPLSQFNYEIVHQDSPDERGIDVALVFINEYFTLLQSQFLTVTSINDPDWKTRDILYVKGITTESDTLHLFVNHWPSRYGGQLETEDYRITAAMVLREKIDQVFAVNPEAKMIVMGDFNDNPIDKSIRIELGVESNGDYTAIRKDKLYNLPRTGEDKKVAGTHKYRMNWALLDQFIVSGKLLEGDSQLTIHPAGFTIFSPGFLLETDEINMGVKPFRTYVGFRYQDGFSDHLPIYIDILKSGSDE